MKKILNYILIAVYMLVFSEIILITFSKLFTISTLEKLKYANKFIVNNVDGEKVFKSHKKNYSGDIMGVNLRFNSLGFRGQDISKNNIDNEKKIMVLGSSLVMGWGVEENKTFAKILEKKINDNKKFYTTTTVNTGIMHTNTEFHYHIFKKNYETINPDLVVLGYFIDDAKNLSTKKLPFFVKYFFLGSVIYQVLKSSSAENLDEYYLRINNKKNENWQNVIKNVNKIRELCEKKNIEFLVVILPDFSNFSENNSLDNLYIDIYNRFNEDEILIINPYKSLQKEFKNNEKNSWISSDDNHPNGKANEIIANEIFDFIDANKLLHIKN